MNRIIKQYDFPVKVIAKPNNKLSRFLRDAPKRSKHNNCTICNSLPDRYVCDVRFVVYKFTCKRCQKSYIGETCRPFYQRYEEHRRSLQAGDKKSALSEHLLTDHSDCTLALNDFHLEILAKLGNPVETKITEAKWIVEARPQLNRKAEMSQW